MRSVSKAVFSGGRHCVLGAVKGPERAQASGAAAAPSPPRARRGCRRYPKLLVGPWLRYNCACALQAAGKRRALLGTASNPQRKSEPAASERRRRRHAQEAAAPACLRRFSPLEGRSELGGLAVGLPAAGERGAGWRYSHEARGSAGVELQQQRGVGDLNKLEEATFNRAFLLRLPRGMPAARAAASPDPRRARASMPVLPIQRRKPSERSASRISVLPSRIPGYAQLFTMQRHLLLPPPPLALPPPHTLQPAVPMHVGMLKLVGLRDK